MKTGIYVLTGCALALGIWKTTSTLFPQHKGSQPPVEEKRVVQTTTPQPQATPSPEPDEDSSDNALVSPVLYYVLSTRGDEWRDSSRWYVSELAARELHRRWHRIYIGPQEKFLPKDGGYTLVYFDDFDGDGIVTYPDGHTLVKIKVHRVGFYNHAIRRRGYNSWEKATLRLVRRKGKWHVLGLKGRWESF